MANEKEKCPICGTKLKMTDGRMTCKQCGYYVRGDAASDYSTGSQNSDTANSSTPRMSSAPQPLPTPQRSGYSHGSSTGKRVGLVIGIVLGINLIVTVLYAFFGFRQNANEERDSYSSNNSVSSERESGSAGSSQAAGRNLRNMPQSSFFRELVEVIFDKNYSIITAEELASITALQIDFDAKEIYYQVNNEDGIPLVFGSSSGISLSDLKCFTGLEYLYVIGKGLNDGDLAGLENLRSIQSENSLEELASIVPYPENIVEIYSVDTFMAKDLTGVEKFTNLQYLTIDYYRLEDISALTNVPGLLGLMLVDCRLTDYSPLMSMTGLEELSIDSSQLKSIDFIKVMPNLTYLYIENSEIPNIDAVSSCPNLTSLHLIKNYSVTDYTPIGDLVNLTDLSIHKTTTKDTTLPSFERLTQLERVYITNLKEHELPLVAAAANINQLYLENNYDDANLELLGNLPLVYLSLVDSSIAGDHPLAFLAQMPDLVYLDLSESHIFGNMEDVFGIPSLVYLDLKETSGVIDFDNLPYNDNLMLLDMSGLEIKVDAWGHDYQDISDHYDMFGHFPNLEELYLAALGIDSIDFVTDLPYLMYLDITDNNVTSLKPLESLFNFDTVYCGDNTILENVSADSGIYVDMDSEYYPY